MAAAPLEQRDYVRLVSDDHGDPPLLAAHSVAATDGVWGPLDAYDWYGTWKLLDGLLGCAFAGVDCQFSLGDTPDQRFMGAWSDGTPGWWKRKSRTIHSRSSASGGEATLDTSHQVLTCGGQTRTYS